MEDQNTSQSLFPMDSSSDSDDGEESGDIGSGSLFPMDGSEESSDSGGSSPIHAMKRKRRSSDSLFEDIEISDDSDSTENDDLEDDDDDNKDLLFSSKRPEDSSDSEDEFNIGLRGWDDEVLAYCRPMYKSYLIVIDVIIDQILYYRRVYPKNYFQNFNFHGVICKKVSKGASERITNKITRFKADLRKRFYEKLEGSDGRLRIEVILNSKTIVEKVWFDFKKIRYTKNRLNRIAKLNQTRDLPEMKYHRWTKRIECDMKVHENFCAIDGGFGNNISDLLRDLLRFLAAEQLDEVKRQLELKIWKIPNVQKPRKLMSAKYLSPLYSPFFTLWTSYRIETKCPNGEK